MEYIIATRNIMMPLIMPRLPSCENECGDIKNIEEKCEYKDSLKRNF